MEFTGQKRQKIGKAVKSLRKEGLIPAVVFGNEIESTAIVLDYIGFSKVFAKAGETALVDLKVDEDTYKVLVNDVQFNPISGKIIHASFYKPNLKEKTEVAIPVEIVGEETNELVKSGAGVVLQLMNEILVSALPTDLIDAFTIDVSGLAEVGASVTVGQLEYDRTKIEIVDMKDTELVVKLDKATMEEEVAEVIPETEQEAIEKLEATAEKKAEDEGEEDKDKE